MSMEAHGALGGIEFRASTYGNIVGRRSISPHGRTPGQLTKRAVFAQAGKSWDGLSSRAKSQWADITPELMTPRGHYIGCFLRKWPLHEIPIYPAPEPIIWATLYDLSLDYYNLPDSVVLNFMADPPGATSQINIYALQTFSRRSAPQHNRGKWVGEGPLWASSTDIILTPGIPIVHLWLQQYDPYTGIKGPTQLFRFEPVWP